MITKYTIILTYLRFDVLFYYWLLASHGPGSLIWLLPITDRGMLAFSMPLHPHRLWVHQFSFTIRTASKGVGLLHLVWAWSNPKVRMTVLRPRKHATLTSTLRMGLSAIVLRRWCSCSHTILPQLRGGNRSIRTPRPLSLFLHYNCHISHSASSRDTLNSGKVFILIPYQRDGAAVHSPATTRSCWTAINSKEAAYRM